ncbi:MAG: hypothetical protein ACT4PE_05745 [Candidatus Eiseniibacteriota bacterium]
MRLILDPHVALVLEGSHTAVLSPDEALDRMRGVTAVRVALTDVGLADSVAPAHHLRQLLAGLPGGRLNLIDRIGADLAQGFLASREDVQRLHAANAAVTVTAYPLVLRRGLERRNLRPDGRWMFIEVAGLRAWLSVWDAARLVQSRQIAMVSDLGAEVGRSLHESLPAEVAPSGFVALTPNPGLLPVLTQEGIRAELLEGPSPAFDGLDHLESDAKFWLPELLHAEEERRLRRRRLLQRTVAVAALIGAAALGGWAEWLRWASEQRVAEAEQGLQRAALARESVLRERADHLRRRLNRPAFRAWTAALTTLAPNDRPSLRATLERGTWKLELETTSFESARRFAAVLGGRTTLLPRRVDDRLGWAVITEIPEEAWIGWPSQESPSGS